MGMPHLVTKYATEVEKPWTDCTLPGMVCLIFLICSLRTNIVFFTIFLTLVLAFCCLAGAYFNLALFYENEMNIGASVTASRLVVVRYITLC